MAVSCKSVCAKGLSSALEPLGHTQCMEIKTIADLKQHLFKKLPPLRRYAIGRRVLDDITEVTIAEFPAEILAACQHDEDRGIVIREMVSTAKRHYCLAYGEDRNNVGFVWTFIVAQLALILIQEIVKWWLEDRRNRYLLDCWQKGE